MQRITPCLWFDHEAEEAARFCTSIFPDSKMGTIAHYGEAGAKASGRQPGSVMTVTFTLDGMDFLGLNGGPMFHFAPSVSFFVRCASVEEVDTLWARLSEGGKALMPLDKYPFSERYGWLADKFGVSWQLFHSPEGRGIAPALLFVGVLHGKAEEAIAFYTSRFDNSRTNLIARYEEGEGDKVGAIKFASITLDGQEIVIMESGGPHAFNFVQSISLMVNCASQAEIDRFWAGLSDGGQTNVCGWLSDKYGLPWQIVPAALGELMKSGDPGRPERVMAELMKMTKIDIAALEKA